MSTVFSCVIRGANASSPIAHHQICTIQGAQSIQLESREFVMQNAKQC